MFFNFGPILFGLAGFIVATYVHTHNKKDAPMICPLNGECDLVTKSRYSKFLKMNVETIGIVYFGLIVFVYTFKMLSPILFGDTVIFILMGVTAGAFLFSLYLLFIQAFVLKKWCTWCLFSFLFSALIFVTVLFGRQIDLVGLLKHYKILIVILHALAAAVGLGAATITDIFFFRFLKDYKISKGESDLMKTLSSVIWLALGIIIVTGVGLFIPRGDELLNSSKFLIKMVAVCVVTVNGIFLNLLVSPRLMEISFGEPHDHRTGELHFMRKLSFALGAISITNWYLIFILGNLKSIPIDFRSALVIYLGILCFAVLGSQVLDRKMRRDFVKQERKDSLQEATISDKNL